MGSLVVDVSGEFTREQEIFCVGRGRRGQNGNMAKKEIIGRILEQSPSRLLYQDVEFVGEMPRPFDTGK